MSAPDRAAAQAAIVRGLVAHVEAGRTLSAQVARARKAFRLMGLTLTTRPTGEYRVNFHGGFEGTAYYATDLADAVGTGAAMWWAGGAR